MVGSNYAQPTLLDCWACRDLKRFRAVLKGGAVGGGSTSGGAHFSSSHPKSPYYSYGSGGTLLGGPCPPSEVNRRDNLGRTVLHLIAANTEPSCVDYLTALLSHPSVNVNLQDHESGWTPLHRALYQGNLLIALTLLKRSPPADHRIKDFEGLTPFDLYNSTVHGTNPRHSEGNDGELYIWGANRNYTLGCGDGDDRALPDRVQLRRKDAESYLREPGAKFDRIKAKDIGMNKFATIILTAEQSSNVWVCGIGANGRIGRAPQTQTSFEPLRDFSDTASAIAVGPDHTCIVTTSGDLYTFGQNRFSQLGYGPEFGQGLVTSTEASKGSGGAATATFGGSANAPPQSVLDVQITPRKVVGQLKKEHVIGAAAGKFHSAAFTSEGLYTWGTNTGQLGYDRSATPTQITPRKVSALSSTQSIRSVAITDYATACLLASGDVVLLHNDTYFFVRFPQAGFSSDMSVFRPRQARPKPSIRKLVAGPNNAFAAISDMGDLWQFTVEHPSEYTRENASSTASSGTKVTIKPQLVWSVRKNKKIGAAKDISMGSGSDLILVTESGHVFVRSKKGEMPSASSTPGSGGGKGKSGWKPVPYLQRVIKVAANESGAWAALKVDAQACDIRVRGKTLQEDLQVLLPHLKAWSLANVKDEELSIAADLAEAAILDDVDDGVRGDDSEADSEGEDSGARYIRMAQLLGEAARRWDSAEGGERYGPHNVELPPFGCDMFVIAGGRYLPAHRTIIAARLPELAPFLKAPPSKGGGGAPNGVVLRKVGNTVTMTLSRCSFGTALFLLHYLYTDDLPAVWTASIGLRIEKQYTVNKLNRSQIHSQLKELASTLGLSALAPALSSPVSRMPAPTLSRDLTTLFREHVGVDPLASPWHDVQLQFSDRLVPAHSVMLRRSPFFAALLQPHWTSFRWEHGTIHIDMSHVRWEVANVALRHIYTDEGTELFNDSDAERTHDQYMDFIVEVMALSNEILLDKLKLVCCVLLRKRLVPSHASAMMTDADFYHAMPLKEIVMDYMSRTMETMLEFGSLDDLEHRMIKDLTHYVRRRQDERLHRTRAEEAITALIIKHHDYYEILDIPPPSLGLIAAKAPKRPPYSPRSGPVDASFSVVQRNGVHLRDSSTPVTSPDFKPVPDTDVGTPGHSQDNSLMFSMDDEDGAIDQSPSMGPHQDRQDIGKCFALPPTANSTRPPITGGVPWRSNTLESEKSAQLLPSSDLRTIMAAEQARRPSPTTAPQPSGGGSGPGSTVASGTVTPVKGGTAQEFTALQLSGRTSQRDRKKQQMNSSPSFGPSAGPAMENRTPSGSGSPWKLPEAVATSSSRSWNQSSQEQQQPSRNQVRTTSASTTPGRPFVTPLQSQSQSQSQLSACKMGPTYTPTRMQSRPTTIKRSTGNEGAPWSSNQSQYPTLTQSGASPSRSNEVWAASSPPSVAASTRAAMAFPSIGSRSTKAGEPTPGTVTGGNKQSFAQIQAEEQKRYEDAYLLQAQTKAKSFAQLQEEDRRESEIQKREQKDREEFEKWFEEESRKIRSEQQRGSGSGSGRGRGGGNNRGGKGGGKGKKEIKEDSGEGHDESGTKEGTCVREGSSSRGARGAKGGGGRGAARGRGRGGGNGHTNPAIPPSSNPLGAPSS